MLGMKTGLVPQQLVAVGVLAKDWWNGRLSDPENNDLKAEAMRTLFAALVGLGAYAAKSRFGAATALVPAALTILDNRSGGTLTTAGCGVYAAGAAVSALRTGDVVTGGKYLAAVAACWFCPSGRVSTLVNKAFHYFDARPTPTFNAKQKAEDVKARDAAARDAAEALGHKV